MRRQSRRLWLGEWQREEESPRARQQAAGDAERGDTFVISPLEGEDPGSPTGPRRTVKRAAVAAAVAALCALAFILASGGSDTPATSGRVASPPPAPAPQVQPQVPPGPQGTAPQGFGGPDLTGPAAVKAAQAAVAKFPGDVERVTHGPTGGGYVVHVIQGDGNEVHVLVDPRFRVRGSDAGGGTAPAPGTSQ
jgi:hypothetical protein